MDKYQAARIREQTQKVTQILNVTIWLLDKCNHSNNGGLSYAHHVRDRISESLTADLIVALDNLSYIQKDIDEAYPIEPEHPDAPPF
jgi:hypothetical protein